LRKSGVRGRGKMQRKGIFSLKYYGYEFNVRVTVNLEISRKKGIYYCCL
jgi:hypothetical protein